MEGICLQTCPIGEYPPANSNQCKACPIGYIKKDTGDHNCQPCKEGTHWSSTNKCEKCQPGYKQPVPGQTSCVKCPKNQYQDEAGQKMCKKCPSDFKSDLEGAVCIY